MKINNINTVSFKGINVSKPSKKETERKSIYGGTDTAAILDRWQSDLDFLVGCYDRYKMPTFRELKADIKTQKVPFKYSQDRDIAKFNHRTEAYKGFSEALAHKTDYVDQMVKIREDAMRALKIAEMGYKKRPDAFVSLPKYRGVEKVAGYKDEIKVLEDEFIFKVREEKSGGNPDIFGSILFFGPNGNGKTYMTKAIAEATDSDIKKISIRSSRDAHIKDGMEKILEAAKDSEKRFNKDRTRTIIFVDEIDKMISEGSPVLKDFSEFIKTCSDKYHCSVFASTNYPLSLGVDYDDPDIFPIKMSIDVPDQKNAKAVIDYYTEGKAKEGEIDTDKLVAIMMQNGAENGGKYSIAKLKQMIVDTAFESREDKVDQQSLENMFVFSTPDLTQDMLDEFQKDYDALIGKAW